MWALIRVAMIASWAQHQQAVHQLQVHRGADYAQQLGHTTWWLSMNIREETPTLSSMSEIWHPPSLVMKIHLCTPLTRKNYSSSIVWSLNRRVFENKKRQWESMQRQMILSCSFIDISYIYIGDDLLVKCSNLFVGGESKDSGTLSKVVTLTRDQEFCLAAPDASISLARCWPRTKGARGAFIHTLHLTGMSFHFVDDQGFVRVARRRLEGANGAWGVKAPCRWPHEADTEPATRGSNLFTRPEGGCAI
jgi:hypothetical protein